MAATGYNIRTTSAEISFRDQTTGLASISYDHATETLNISHDGTGDISIGDTSSDIYIGDGINNVDVIYETDGGIYADAGSTLTIGLSTSNVEIDSPTLINNDLDVTGSLDVTGNITMTGATVATQSWVLSQDYITTSQEEQDLNSVLTQGNTSSQNISVGAITGSDLTIDTDTLYVDSANNRVGIGTTSPAARLHVEDTSLGYNQAVFKAVGGSATVQIDGQGTVWSPKINLTNTNQGIAYKGSGRSRIWATNSIDIEDKLTNHLVRFDTDNLKVGIGTTSPSYELDVSGTGHFAYDLYVDADLDVTGDITMAGNTVLTGITSGDVTGALGYTPVNVNDTGDFVTSAETGSFLTDYTVTEADVTGHQAALTITESQISDLQSYLTSVSESDVTQHEGALTLTSGQITGALGFSPISTETDDQTLDEVLTQGNTSSSEITVGGATINGDLDVTGDATVTGSLGIGTNSPSQKLHVEGVTYSTLGFKVANGYSIGALGYNSALRFNNGNILVNNSSAAEFVRFDATNSRVGIGTTSPDQSLEVDIGSVSSNDGVSENQGVKVVANAGGAIGFGGYLMELDNSTADASAFVRLARTAGTAYLGLEIGAQSRDGIRFSTHATNNFNNLEERMRIDSSGNVGIGTTSPSSVLEVVDASTNATARGVIIRNTSSSNDPSFRIGVGYAGMYDDSLTILRNSTILQYLTDQGTFFTQDIGIATSKQLKAFNSGLAYLDIYNGSANTELSASTDLIFKTTGTERVRIKTSSGNVGIGTTSPSYRLDVSGDSTSGVIAVRNTANGRDTFRSENASGVRTFNIGNDANGHGLVLVRGAGGTTTSQIAGNGDTYFDTDTLYIDHSANNVGIGTTSPDSKLHIDSSGEALRFTRSAQETYRLIHGTSGLYFTRPNSSSLAFGVTHNSDFDIFDTSANIMFRADASTGNVGIGTTSPSAKLEVNGHFMATTKSFIIDNPKTGGKLQYGVVESDQHSVLVRGKNDTNEIELPEEWEWLVDPDSVTVQLTSIGQMQSLFVISQDNKKIKIGGLATSGQYNYTVYGERVDVDKLQKHLK